MIRRESDSVLELRAVPAEVVGCFGRPAALDRLAEGAELGVRVAPDELLLLSPEENGTRPGRISKIESLLGSHDGGGLVLDLSDGFAVWTLFGDQRFEAFGRLSALPLPASPACIQGLIAHVPAKVVVRTDSLLLIVPSVLSHHLRDRVLASCADLAPIERRDSRPMAAAVEQRGRG
jgi:hypothetical protein